MVARPQEERRLPRVPRRRLFTIDEYDRMIEAGIFCEDDRVELVGGEIFEMAAMGPRHVLVILILQGRFIEYGLPSDRVRLAFPVRLPPRSEPQPDIAIVREGARSYATRHPNPEDVLLAIEVSDSSLRYDRNRKLPRYAECGVPEVWIWDPPHNQVLVCRDPKSRRYEQITTVGRGGSVSPLAFPELVIAVDDVLG